MRKAALCAATAAAAFFVAGAVHAQAKPAPEKGKSTQRKPEAPARGGYDIKKSTGASKAPNADRGTTSKPRQGLEANASSAQGVAGRE